MVSNLTLQPCSTALLTKTSHLHGTIHSFNSPLVGGSGSDRTSLASATVSWWTLLAGNLISIKFHMDFALLKKDHPDIYSVKTKFDSLLTPMNQEPGVKPLSQAAAELV